MDERMINGSQDEERRMRAYELYRQGLDWAIVARRLGYSDRDAAAGAARNWARKHERTWPPLIAALALIAAILPGRLEAASFWPLNATADISIGANATANIGFSAIGAPGLGRIDWLYIRNDCAGSLYFSLGHRQRSTSDYGLRLDQNDVWEGEVEVVEIGVQEKNGSTGCTFTLQPMYRR